MTRPGTPSQTIGPFFAVGLPWSDGPNVVPDGTPKAIWLRGRVVDGRGDPVPDALVEIWQADAGGRFDHPDDPRGSDSRFRGFGRCAVDEEGQFAFLTVKPGAVPWPDGRAQAPHIDVSVFARGLLKRVISRIYFPDEQTANAADPVLTSLKDPEARATLVAGRIPDGYHFDIRLQGERETVFFEL